MRFAVSVDGYHNDEYSCTFDRQLATSPLGYKGIRPALYVSSKTTFADITDGSSNTIVLSEMSCAARVRRASITIWIFAAAGSIFSGAASAGGSRPTRAWATNARATARRAIRTRPAQDYAYPYWGHWANAAQSRHPGGVNVCMVDGSVHFVTNNIDLAIWQALISANGGEMVSIGD